MKKHSYDILGQPILASAGCELVRIKEEYPALPDDICNWTYQGRTLAEYEALRQQYIVRLKENHKSDRLSDEDAEIFVKAAKWFAFQVVFEESYRIRFAKEVVISMLKKEKYTLEDITEILPYVDVREIKEFERKIREGKSDLEVLQYG